MDQAWKRNCTETQGRPWLDACKRQFEGCWLFGSACKVMDMNCWDQEGEGATAVLVLKFEARRVSLTCPQGFQAAALVRNVSCWLTEVKAKTWRLDDAMRSVTCARPSLFLCPLNVAYPTWGVAIARPTRLQCVFRSVWASRAERPSSCTGGALELRLEIEALVETSRCFQCR